jgi:pimeloyl-ACP methyl ester carboxylesterase
VPARADGSHLPWYWARIRDQTIFFPWYRKTKETRMRFDVPPAGMLQPYLIDLLLADRIGTPAYAAAFRYPARERAAQFVAPTYLLNYPADAISHHPERLGALPQCVVREMLPDPQALLDRASELLLAQASDSVTPPPPPQPEQRRFVDTDAGQLMVRSIGSGPNVLLLHPPGSSSARYMPDEALVTGHGLVVPDLPGHGGSSHAPCESFAMLVRVVEQVAEQMEATQIVAFEGSGQVALALWANRPDLQIILVDGPDPDTEVWPELTPEDHGGHLLAAWRCARDSQLFRPWHQADLAHSLVWDFNLAPDEIHKRTVDLLVAAASLQSWSQLAEAGPALDPVSLSKGTPIRVIARAGSGTEASSQELAQAAGVKLEMCDPGDKWQTIFGDSLRER